MTTGRRNRDSIPSFRELSPREVRTLLTRNHVGRIAYSIRDRVTIEPVHYVRDGAWLYVRTSHGSKTTTLAKNRWLAFEVDEVEDVFRWASVVIRGTAYVLTPDGPADLAARYHRAVTRLRRIMPGAFSAAGPVPFRTIVLGIYIESATGRKASQSSNPKKSRRNR